MYDEFHLGIKNIICEDLVEIGGDQRNQQAQPVNWKSLSGDGLGNRTPKGKMVNKLSRIISYLSAASLVMIVGVLSRNGCADGGGLPSMLSAGALIGSGRAMEPMQTNAGGASKSIKTMHGQ